MGMRRGRLIIIAAVFLAVFAVVAWRQLSPSTTPSADAVSTPAQQRAAAAAPTLALQKIAGSYSQPVYVAQPPGDASRLFVVEQTGLIRIVKDGTLLAAAVPGHPHAGVHRQRTRPALHGLRPQVRDQPAFLRRLHEHRRGHEGRALPGVGLEPGPRRHVHRPRAPAHRPAIQQPQRRPAAVRAGRPPVRRHGRRRQRRRPRQPCPEQRQPSRQDPAHHPGHLPPEGRDVHEGDAQSVALLFRPRQRQPLDRRRRPGRVGGDRPPARRASGRAPTSAGAATRARTSTTRRAPPGWTRASWSGR